jgi:hypothetical protein
MPGGEKNNRRSAMENRRRLQCKVLRGREKSRRRKNNGKQWKKQWKAMKEQWEEQWKRSEIRASAYVRSGGIKTAPCCA